MGLEEDLNQSETEDKIKEDTRKVIEQANAILKHIKDSKGEDSEDYKNAVSAYKSIENEIKLSMESEKKITDDELKKIKLELEDLKLLQEINLYINENKNISEENITYIADKIDILIQGYEIINIKDFKGLTEVEIKKELEEKGIPENKITIILSIFKRIDFIKNSEKILKSLETIDYKKSEEKTASLQKAEEEKVVATKKSITIEVKINPTGDEVPNTLNETEFTQTESGEYSFENPNGGGTISVSAEEKDIIQQNPDAYKNLINFYNFFKEINLEGVWKYRRELVNAIGDIHIDINDDSLSKKELILFGNKVIQIINNMSLENGQNSIKLQSQSNLNGIEQELRKYSQAGSILSDEKTFNNLGEDIFSAQLRNLGIIGGAYFHTYRLRELATKVK